MLNLLFTDNRGENNRDYVYRVLRTNIVYGHLKPGTRFNEQEVAALLNISRSPVRDAISRLHYDHLVDVVPQKYTAVSKIDWSYICEGVEIRRIVEAAVLKEACGKIGPEYQAKLRSSLALQKFYLHETKDIGQFQWEDWNMHRIIYESIGREWSWELVSKASQHLERYLYIDDPSLSYMRLPHLENILNMHIELVEALTTNTPIDFNAFTQKHIFNFNSLPDILDIAVLDNFKYKDYFVTPSPYTIERLKQLRDSAK